MVQQEIICVHIGQAGIQISNAAWELFCIEHGIEANGRLREHLSDTDSQAFRTFFSEAPTGQYVPRCLTFDLEPTVVDEVRTGNYRNLFHPEQIINGFEDGANNYARGHFTVGKTLIDSAMYVIRKIVENCESLQGFFMIHSHGGGTGSGFTSLVLDCLNVEFAKSPAIQLSVFPSPIMPSAVVEPYNCILSSYTDVEKSDITILVNNEASYNLCHHSLDIPRPTFSNINRVISSVFSDLTVSLRFESSLNADFIQMSTNLIPFPRIHFPMMTHAPLINSNRADHEALTVQQITRSCFDNKNQLLTCNASEGLYMSCVIQYRGNVNPKDVNIAIFDIKRKQEIKFVEWCPTGFKIGINSQPKTMVPSGEMCMSDRSATMICNSTAIREPIQNIMDKFEVLFSKRSFVHWFVGEGMEEGEFNEARDEFRALTQDYIEIAKPLQLDEDGGADGGGGNVDAAPPPPMSMPLSDTDDQGGNTAEYNAESEPGMGGADTGDPDDYGKGGDYGEDPGEEGGHEQEEATEEEYDDSEGESEDEDEDEDDSDDLY